MMRASQIGSEDKMKSKEKYIVTGEMKRQASEIVRQQYVAQYGDENVTALYIVINDIAIATTLRRINRDLDPLILRSLDKDTYDKLRG